MPLSPTEPTLTAPEPGQPVVPAVTFVTVYAEPGDKFTRTAPDRPLYSGPPEHAHHVLPPGRYDAMGARGDTDVPGRWCDLIVAEGSSHAEFTPDGPERILLLTRALHAALWHAGVDLLDRALPMPDLDHGLPSIGDACAVLRAEVARQATR